MDKNIVYVTTDLNDSKLWSRSIDLTSLWWINQPPVDAKTYQVKTRYRADGVDCKIEIHENGVTLQMDDEVRAVSPGQSAVVYEGDLVIGGGIIQRGQ